MADKTLPTLDAGTAISAGDLFLTRQGSDTSDKKVTGTQLSAFTESQGFYKAGGTDVALADGGTGASLTDPGADRLLFWDDSASAVTWLTLGTHLSITGTTLNATGGGGGGGDVTAAANLTDNALVRGDGGAKGVQTSGIIIDDSDNVSGMGTLSSAAHLITSTSTQALIVGPNGATGPTFTVNSNTASAATGVSITGAAAGGGVALSVTSPNANEALNITSKGNATLTFGTLGTAGFGFPTTLRHSFSTTGVSFTPTALATASAIRFSVVGAADTALTAGAEAPWIYFNGSATRTHASNTTIALQRDFRISGSAHAFATAGGTLTDHQVVSIDAPPAAGANATITDACSLYLGGKQKFDTTITPGGTTGAQTINKPTGTVNFAAGATSLVVTNSMCRTSSIVTAVIRTNDATAVIKNVIPANGSFTINLNAAATAETSVGFIVYN